MLLWVYCYFTPLHLPPHPISHFGCYFKNPVIFQGSNIINASCSVTEETDEELAQVVSPPIIRSHAQPSTTSLQFGEQNAVIAKEFDITKKETLETVVVTTEIGSSLVNVNQQMPCHSHKIDIGNTGDSSHVSTMFLKGQEVSMPKQVDTSSESPKRDHVTLLSVGDIPDTQFRVEKS